MIYDTVDLHWVRFERGFEVLEDDEHLSRKSEAYKRLELANARASDVTIAVTEDEKSRLLAEDASLRVRVVPNIHETSERVPPFEERADSSSSAGSTMHRTRMPSDTSYRASSRWWSPDFQRSSS